MTHHKIVVFDVGGTQTRIALFENGQIIRRDQLATPGKSGPDATVEMMAQLFTALGSPAAADGVAADGVAAVGVAITGQVVNGCVTAHNPAILSDWHNYPMQQRLSERLQQPVRLINDARAAAWGEYRYGSGQGYDEFLFLTVSTGVGAGLILNRQLHLAKNGFDAEIGEMRCADGRTLEDHASGTALGQLAVQYGYASAKALCDAADAGDLKADALFQNGIAQIAAKLADLAVMLGIQRVAVGGSVGLRPGYLDRLKREMEQFPAIYQLELVAAQLGHDAGLVGAADLA